MTDIARVLLAAALLSGCAEAAPAPVAVDYEAPPRLHVQRARRLDRLPADIDGRLKALEDRVRALRDRVFPQARPGE